MSRPALPPDPSDDAPPRFLWDRGWTSAEVRAILADRDDPRRLEVLAALLREARPGEVWSWVRPEEVRDAFPELAPRLGRRRAFWTWLLQTWQDDGLL